MELSTKFVKAYSILLCVLLDVFTCYSLATECTNGFSSMSEIETTDQDRVATLPTVDFRFRQWIFPNINFTCDTNITGWIFQGEMFNTPPLNSLFQDGMPQFEIWRDNEFTQPTTDLRRVHTTETTTRVNATHTDRTNISVFQYTLSEPIAMKPGDIMGIAMRDETPRLRMRFLDLGENGEMLSYRISGSGSDMVFDPESNQVEVRNETRYTPLVTALVDLPEGTSPPTTVTMIPTTASTSTTTTPMPTPSIPVRVTNTTPPLPPPVTTMISVVSPRETDLPTTPPIPRTDDGGVDLNLIIGAVVALLFVIVLVLVAVLIALVVIRKRQTKYAVPKPTHSSDLDNPNYQTIDVDDPLNKGGTMTSNGLEPGPIYALPLASPTFQPQICSPHPAAESNLDGIVTEHYEFPQDMVPNQHDPLSPISNDPEYAQPSVATMSRPYEVPLSTLKANREAMLMNHEYSILEGGIYVPTEEERQSLSRPSTAASSNTGVFDDNIYSRMSRKYKGRLDDGMFFPQEDSYWKPASSKTALYDQLANKKYREILRQQIQIVKHLGSGQFGTVNKGLWQSPSGTMEVAVKTLQPLASETDKVKFLQEAAIMGQFLHPNVVKLYGVVTVGEPVMIVLEYMQKGDLRNYLLSRQLQPGELVPSDLPILLIKFCREIASGMNYLCNKAFVHRDLAARNILLAEDNTCKIGDFGMSRDLEDNNYYITHGGKIPVKWTAPEALHFRRYSNASDVWSYGCVMYEIWSLGHKPLEGYTNIQSMQLIGSGYRMPPPPGCPKALYELMIRCWHSDASRRPTFSAIFNMLSHSESHLLLWSEQDRAVHPQASCLGAALEAGERLYPDLQDYYIDKDNN